MSKDRYRAELVVTFACGLCEKEETLTFSLPCERRTGQEVHVSLPKRGDGAAVHRLTPTVEGKHVKVEGPLRCRRGHDICEECNLALDQAEAAVCRVRYSTPFAVSVVGAEEEDVKVVQLYEVYRDDGGRFGHWRQRAHAVIQPVLAAFKDGDDPGWTLAAIDAAYPFGVRDYYPYKAWLKERTFARWALGLLEPPVEVQRRKSNLDFLAAQQEMEAQGQMRLWDDDAA